MDLIRALAPRTRVNTPPDPAAVLDDLMFAALHGRIGIVKTLLEAGADVNARSAVHDSTALMLAAGKGHVDVVKVLLDHGARADDKDSVGKTSLAFAAGVGDVKIVEALLAAGADVNASDNLGTTPLMWAAGEGHLDIVKALLNAGANVRAANKNGETALSLVPTNIGWGRRALTSHSRERTAEIARLLKEEEQKGKGERPIS